MGARLGHRRRCRDGGAEIAKALGARRSSPRRATRSSSARGSSAPTPSSTTHTGDVAAAAKEATGGAGIDVVVEHVGEATWKTSLAVAAPGGRIAVCGATSGPNPPAQLHRVWWKQLTIVGSTMGTRADFEAAYELVRSGRAKPVIDRVYPLEAIRERTSASRRASSSARSCLAIPWAAPTSSDASERVAMSARALSGVSQSRG